MIPNVIRLQERCKILEEQNRDLANAVGALCDALDYVAAGARPLTSTRVAALTGEARRLRTKVLDRS